MEDCWAGYTGSIFCRCWLCHRVTLDWTPGHRVPWFPSKRCCAHTPRARPPYRLPTCRTTFLPVFCAFSDSVRARALLRNMAHGSARAQRRCLPASGDSRQPCSPSAALALRCLPTPRGALLYNAPPTHTGNATTPFPPTIPPHLPPPLYCRTLYRAYHPHPTTPLPPPTTPTTYHRCQRFLWYYSSYLQ